MLESMLPDVVTQLAALLHSGESDDVRFAIKQILDFTLPKPQPAPAVAADRTLIFTRALREIAHGPPEPEIVVDDD